MATLRFVPQATLDGWVEEGKVDPQAGRIIEMANQVEYPTKEAVHFVKAESGQDSQGLVNKVKTLEQVKALGGEHYLTSVILGETVYEVVPGWLAEDGAAPPKQATPKQGSKGYEGKNQDADLLAKLLLDKLS